MFVRCMFVAHTFVSGILSALVMMVLLAYSVLVPSCANVVAKLMEQDVPKLEELVAESVVAKDDFLTFSVEYYVRKHGYDYAYSVCETSDNFLLGMDRVYCQDKLNARCSPVILMHGLFQGSGVFATSGRVSLAFYLADLGFDVYMPNNRCGDPRLRRLHSKLNPRLDAGVWNWTLTSIAAFDVPAIISHVRNVTNHQKVTWIGHSQGNAQIFLALHLRPWLNNQLASIVALAPALYMGPLAGHSWAPVRKPGESLFAARTRAANEACAAQAALAGPFAMLVRFAMASCPTLQRKSSDWFHRLFGPGTFVGIMHQVQQRRICSWAFASLAYSMFSYVFGWSDRNWDVTRKSAYFQFTPRHVSTSHLREWLANAHAGYVRAVRKYAPSQAPCSAAAPQDAPVDLDRVRVPVALYSGGRDYLVSTTPFRDSSIRVQLEARALSSTAETGVPITKPSRATRPHHAHHDSAVAQMSPLQKKSTLSYDSDTASSISLDVEPFRPTVDCEIPHYEHMDFLWARDASKVLWPQLVEFITRNDG